MNLEIILEDENKTAQCGKILAQCIHSPFSLYFQGELGSGKTTMIRAFLQAKGIVGAIKSPTFAIVETYQFNHDILHHFDFYRIRAAEELEFMGIRDYFADNAIVLIEWPEKGEGITPEPDCIFNLSILTQGRKLTCQAKSEKGKIFLKRFSDLIYSS